MELPQPRPYGSEGKKSTHDFLSLYSPVQQDPRSSQGGYLKTQDFLQPLERVGKNVSKEEDKAEPPSPHVEKSRPPAPPPTSSSSLEHILPGGIGTYSISHISYINERFPKPEGIMVNLAPPAQASSSDRNDENSNCSSYTGSGFTLWDESVVMNKGQTGKENNTDAKERQAVREAGVPVSGQWASSLEHQSQSSSSHTFLNKAFSSLSSSQQSFSKKQSFMDMIKSARNGEDDEDEDDDGFVIKKEPSSYPKGNMTVKVDGKGTDQKPNTPRSKHSATEQRRRSKINDRFQMLRGLIPHSDQKRDKASFLLEVIEYIQFLQDKVHKYEDPYQGWSQEPSKLIPLAKGHRTIEAFADQLGATNFGSSSALVFAKFDETNINISPTMPRVGHPIIEPEIVVDTIKEMDHHRIGLTSKGLPIALPLQQTMNSHKGSSTVAVPLPPHVTSNSEIRTSQPQSQQRQSRFSGTDSTIVTEKVKAQELTIESGTISVSSVYSQGLLNTLTQSLQNSGVDLSQATISVQIDIGNRGNSALTPSISTIKTNTNDIPSTNQTMLRPRLASSGAEYDQALKRLKKGRS